MFWRARRSVIAGRCRAITIDAEATKQYRKLGGTFHFEYGDTFIKGLHQRTRDYWEETRGHHTGSKQGQQQQGAPRVARDLAVEEILLRLKWDERVPGARTRLERIIGLLWDTLTKTPTSETCVPSSLYDF
eukprot:TRINITY_DN6954_c0_g1_i1.p1 TRINITY_DN6954_c0_g1~~TRINITY_DN6954_c0_g1_i1.p1  ORF type:complete len:150 (-),score=38.22 TRINITY_DN6954_c0_g1_i1:192-584(-)